MRASVEPSQLRWLLRWLLPPLLAAVLLAALVDPRSPVAFGAERITAVLLLDGQAYFGHLTDRPWSETVELRDVYYLQDARATSTNLPLGLVQRGGEVHRPTDGMTLRRDKILAIEAVGATSQVLVAIAAERALLRAAR